MSTAKHVMKVRVCPPQSPDMGANMDYWAMKRSPPASVATERSTAFKLLRMMAANGFKLGDKVRVQSPVDGIEYDGRWTRIVMKNGTWSVAVRLVGDENDNMMASRDVVQRWIKTGQFVKMT
jgi:hypothetical protein